MHISEAARKAQLPIKTIRYYADIGLVAPVGRTASGYRQYDSPTIGRLIFVRQAREFGFSIDECRELLALYDGASQNHEEVRALAQVKKDAIKRKQQDLQQLHDQLTELITACEAAEQSGTAACPILQYLGN
ncbi:MAG: MerR family DNA-binding protein [Actinomycetia bacterium]|nr:MerR family DNA-binding protein [Actinomycetes bacterium]